MTMNKTIEMVALFFLCGAIMAAGNTVGYKINVMDSLSGAFVIAAIAAIGFLISKLPVFSKLPVVFWVSIIAIYASTSLFPWSGWVLATAKKMQFLAVTTPILAYAGLAVGKDLGMFRKISWRIVPVAIAVFAGTFLFSAILAHFTLRWQGIYH